MRTHRIKLRKTFPHTPLGSADIRGTGFEHWVHAALASGEAHGRSGDEGEPAFEILELRAGLVDGGAAGSRAARREPHLLAL